MKKLRFLLSLTALLLVVFAGTTTLSSCKKPIFYSTENLTFSRDTVVFDTVFTTIGSTTKLFKLYNNDNRTLKIDQIELMGGGNSPFHMNVDGVIGTNVADVEVGAGDSLYVFVEVELEANNVLNPMIIEDSIRFMTNGTDQFVQLVAWGQDAYFHYSEIMNTQTWANDKPHVIYNFAAIDSAETLTIPSGTEIYMHKNAILYNYKGTLNINGTFNDPVTMQGDRLESFYDDVSGQYYGIYMQEALPSTIDYCYIKNATAGVHLFSEDPNNSGYTLTMTNSTITNCARYGMFLFNDELKPNPKVWAENCIIGYNEFHALFVLGGADFNFNHCHLVGYNSGANQTPAVGISNYYVNPNTQTNTITSIDEGVITNSVIYGLLDQEIVLDTLNPGQIYDFSGMNFEGNDIKYEDFPATDPIFSANNLWNEDPLFIDANEGDFYYYSTSPLNNAASPSFPATLPNGINNVPRGFPGPDIGAYERP